MAVKPVKKKAVKKTVRKKTSPKLQFIDITVTDKKDYLQVRQINIETDRLSEALGMTKERSQELEDLAKKSFIVTKRMSEAMVVASSECKHANELIYLGFLMSDIRHQNNHGGMPPFLAHLLSQSRGPKKKDDNDDGN